MAPNTSTSEKNLSAVLHGIDDLRIEERPIPSPGEHQLLIKVHTVGICGSDVHYLTHGAIGPFVVKAPMVLGHETSGVIVGLGAKVTGFDIGDRVALEPGVGCRRCDPCKTGRYNLCPDMAFAATPPIDGTLCRYVAYDADFCFKLPDCMTMEEGALMEPLSVAVHACRRAGVAVGQRVLVLGAGPIGLLNLITAKAMGATTVVVTDIDNARLELAREMGADNTIQVREMSPKGVAEAVKTRFGGQQPDVTIDCVGVPSSMEAGIWTTKSGGVLVLVGMGGPDRVELPIIEAAIREVDIRGIFRYANCYPTAIRMVASGKVDLKKLTRAHYKLENSIEAFNRAKKADVVKVFINCEQGESTTA